MSGYKKEEIFTELRQYHLEKFHLPPSSSDLLALRNDFTVIEDGVVGLILGVSAGKVEYSDKDGELDLMASRVELLNSKQTSRSEKDFFLGKIKQLKKMLLMVRDAKFILRKPRRTLKPIVGKTVKEEK